MKDSDFLLHMLAGRDWVSLDEIIQESQTKRGYGLTVHSRAADLRRRGHVIGTRQERTPLGRVRSFYRLVTLDEPADAIGEGHAAGSSSVSEQVGADELTGSPSSSRLVEPADTLPLFPLPVRGAYQESSHG